VIEQTALTQSPAAAHASAAAGQPPLASTGPHADARGEAILVTVYGDPAPQGSKSYKGTRISKQTGKRTPILVESSKKVDPWRADVEAAARRAMTVKHVTVYGGWPAGGPIGFPLTGPLEIGVIFTLAPPARMPKERIVGGIALPMCYPDLSKLLRSTEDALTTAGVWLDDAQVVNCRELGKRYAGQPGALDRPGAVIRVWRIGGVS
jgi:crossover junction endodeoxyribonuclease RusA